MTREESIKLHKFIKERYTGKLQFRCIADEIWLYCRYLFDEIDTMLKYTNTNFAQDIVYNNPHYKDIKENGYDSAFYKELKNIYQNVRGETFYTGKKPGSMGSAIFSLCCDIYGIFLTKGTIGEFTLTSTGSMYKAAELIKKNVSNVRFMPENWERIKCISCRVAVAVFIKRDMKFKCSRCRYEWDPRRIEEKEENKVS